MGKDNEIIEEKTVLSERIIQEIRQIIHYGNTEDFKNFISREENVDAEFDAHLHSWGYDYISTALSKYIANQNISIFELVRLVANDSRTKIDINNADEPSLLYIAIKSYIDLFSDCDRTSFNDKCFYDPNIDVLDDRVYDYIKAIRFICAHPKIDPNACIPSNGQRVLFYAARHGVEELVELILERDDIIIDFPIDSFTPEVQELFAQHEARILSETDDVIQISDDVPLVSGDDIFDDTGVM